MSYLTNVYDIDISHDKMSIIGKGAEKALELLEYIVYHALYKNEFLHTARDRAREVLAMDLVYVNALDRELLNIVADCNPPVVLSDEIISVLLQENILEEEE